MLNKFVAVRLVRARSLDLSVFQFDYDLTFAVFFLNADKTIYGRYGSRSDRFDADREISLEGLRKSMRKALDLHARFPANKATLRGKALTSRYARLTDYPSFGSSERSCGHCHWVRHAEHLVHVAAKIPIPDKLLFPWPMPDVLGLVLDRDEAATVKEVQSDSAARAAGFRAGDQILSLDGQAIVSIADVQWVLHNADDAKPVQAEIEREGQVRKLTLSLPKQWRRSADSSWRQSMDDLRFSVFGEMRLVEPTAAERERNDLADSTLALKVRIPLSQQMTWKSALATGDILVAFDGETGRMSPTDVLFRYVQMGAAETSVKANVIREGKRLELELPLGGFSTELIR